MAERFSAEWAKGVIDDNMQKAQSFIDNPEQIDGLLEQLQEKLKGVPDVVGTAFNNVPVMAQMVKSYVTREYTEVSPKVIVSLVATFVYLVKKEDLIPDSIPIVGFADDLAVAAVAMAINEPELKAFSEWQAQKAAAPKDRASAGPVVVEPVDAEDAAMPVDVEPIDAVDVVDVIEPADAVEPAESDGFDVQQ